MNKTARLSSNHIRDALRLVNELHELPEDPLVRRKHMLPRLCTLLAADTGIAVTLKADVDGVVSTRGNIVSHGWESAAESANAEKFFREEPEPSPLIRPVVRQSIRLGHAVATLCRKDVFEDEEWYASPVVQLRRQVLHVDECMASLHPLGRGDKGAWLFFYRRPGHRKPFERVDSELLQIIHAELDWMYRPNHSTREPPEFRVLTVRQRQTIYRLLAGDSEKQVAAGLGLSRHTVHVHVKSIYKVFKVNTRQELLARFVRSPMR